ncbi:uncharacterized protein N7503_006390 [Penicillium pulvis]|uniref:uncharacterized protein n=1 Tax=Penicillium pulvis TaxID=1562058 RepID=UPI0025477C26|nr:uncharacterized protein N7503_006390 [Penicillium pulvis]KAJ5798885.1 hypothetical protein N7503_006390 [Penicillium pulvis]
MRSFYILFAFLAATVMAAPIIGQPSEKLTKRQSTSKRQSPVEASSGTWKVRGSNPAVQNIQLSPAMTPVWILLRSALVLVFPYKS